MGSIGLTNNKIEVFNHKPGEIKYRQVVQEFVYSFRCGISQQ